MKNKALTTVLAVLAGIGLAGRARGADPNPFLERSPLQYQTPPFDKIHDSDYGPAIEEGMKRQIVEIEAIANDPAAPTFANTLEAMERSGELLTRVTKVFFNLAQSNTNDAMQKIRADEAPKLAAHQDSIFLNAKLYSRVKALYDKRDALGLDPESAYLLERYHLDFVRAGAELAAGRSGETSGAERRGGESHDEVLRAAARRHERVVGRDRRRRSELEGLSEGDVAAAAGRAKDRGMNGKWVSPLRTRRSSRRSPL